MFFLLKEKNKILFFVKTNNGDIMELMDLLTIVGRSILSLALLFLVTKALGKKQVSQLSLFDYVIGISIGNFAAEMTINLEINYLNGVVSIVVFGGIAYLISYITMKSIYLRRFFMGVPTILIQNGKILEKNLRKVKFDVNDLLEECRGNGYFDLNEIEYGIMEVNGKVSILPKAEHKPVTLKDMQLKCQKSSLCANVIIDGHIMTNNLKNMNKNKNWLEQELKIKGSNIEDILLATLDNQEKLTIYKRNENLEVQNILE